jgi:hypothetical protein
MSDYAEQDSLRVLRAHEQFIFKPFLLDELVSHVNARRRAIVAKRVLPAAIAE